MQQDGGMDPVASSVVDSPTLRKARGAFFTPEEITRFVTRWALRSAADRVLEPSAGDAAFLVAAVDRLRDLAGDSSVVPVVEAVEIHGQSVRAAEARVASTGGRAEIREADFFTVDPHPSYDAVVGNPPYIRYQGFTGEQRSRAQRAALRGGVSLNGLASSWAAFTIHSSLFLKAGGRLGLVLPAELLTVNYAAPVRRYLFDHFRSVDLVMFDEQVFPNAEADALLLLADGYRQGPTDQAVIRSARNAAALTTLAPGQSWTPTDPSAKWTIGLVDPDASFALQVLRDQESLTTLKAWGDTSLGMVTGNNTYFTMSPQRARDLGLGRSELLRISPPGSSHLRGLAMTRQKLDALGQAGRATWMFYPDDQPSSAAAAYIKDGLRTGVHEAYKCRVRQTWYKVPLLPPSDLLLTCMNADTPRLVTNSAHARHLNSVHGVRLKPEVRDIGNELLSLASLNSATLLSAELVGRAYGGGVLKIEPREADVWAMPSFTMVCENAGVLREAKGAVSRHLDRGELARAVAIIDDIVLKDLGKSAREALRGARAVLSGRRTSRSGNGR